jgi:hypothetical protein
MKRLFLPIGVALVAANLTAATIDLTPRYADTFIDGVNARRLYFLENSKKIGISLDFETQVAADGGGGVIFKFPKFPDSSFRIGRSPLTAEEPMSELSLGRYRTAAQTFVPGGATEVKVVEESANPLPINKWQSYRFLVTYQVGAAAMRQSVTFLNLNPQTQVILLTTSSPKSFAEAAERSFQIIRSWHEMLPGDEVPVKGN